MLSVQRHNNQRIRQEAYDYDNNNMTTNSSAGVRLSAAPKYSFKRTYQISEAFQRHALESANGNNNNNNNNHSKNFNASTKRQQNESINTSSGSSSGYLSTLTPNVVENNNNIYASATSKPQVEQLGSHIEQRFKIAHTPMTPMRAALSQHEYQQQQQQPMIHQLQQHQHRASRSSGSMRTAAMVPMMIDDDEEDDDEHDGEREDAEEERFNNVDHLIDDDIVDVDYRLTNADDNNNNHTTLSALRALQLVRQHHQRHPQLQFQQQQQQQQQQHQQHHNHQKQNRYSTSLDCADAQLEQQRARLDLHHQHRYLQVNDFSADTTIAPQKQRQQLNNNNNNNNIHIVANARSSNTLVPQSNTYQKYPLPLNETSASSSTSNQNKAHQIFYHPQQIIEPPVNSFSYLHYHQPHLQIQQQQQQIASYNYQNQYHQLANLNDQYTAVSSVANIKQTKPFAPGDEISIKSKKSKKSESKKKKQAKNKMQGSRQQLTPNITNDSLHHHHHHHHNQAHSSKRPKVSNVDAGGGGGRNTPASSSAPKSYNNNKASIKEKPALSCCGKFTKLLLFVTNISFWLSGIALGAWGILQLVDDHKYNLSQLLVFEPNSRMSLFQLLSWSFITLGCATILVGFCGCSAILKNNRWILGLYIFLIMAIFALDLATGLLAIIFQEKLVANVRLRLGNKLRSEYGVQASFTAAIDYIQTKYECCGLEGHFDYDQSLWRLQRLGGFEATVARTCCHLRNNYDDQAHINPRPVNESMCQSTDVRFHQSYRFRKGCLDDLERLVRQKIWFFTIGCGAVGGVILLSLLFATCFCRSIPGGNSKKNSNANVKRDDNYNERIQPSSSIIEAQRNKIYNKKLKGDVNEDEFS